MDHPPGQGGGARPGSPVYVLPAYGAEDEVDLRDYVRAVLARRRLIAGIVAACTALAVVVSLVMTPVYEATAVIAPVDDQREGALAGLANQFGGLATLAGVPVGGSDRTQERIAILTSRAFTAQLVEENDLLPQLFPDLWDPERGAWRVPPDEVPTLWDAYRRFEKIRRVDEDPKTGLVQVSIEDPVPERAARWVALHVDGVNRHLQAEAVREAEDSIAYLMEQVGRTSDVELRQTLFKLVESQTKQAMLARVRDDFAFKVIDPPVPPDRRARPRRALMVAVTLVGSTLAAVFLALVLEAWRRPPRAQAPPAGGGAEAGEAETAP
jgi:uncharacterized protein involved in exopolysaccharide biosynthesis